MKAFNMVAASAFMTASTCLASSHVWDVRMGLSDQGRDCHGVFAGGVDED